MCAKPFIDWRNRIGVSWHILWTIKRLEELNILLPFSLDVKVEQSQREQVVVIGFLASLPFDYDLAKSQILSSTEILFLQDIFSRIHHTKNSSSMYPPTQLSCALVSRNNGKPRT